MEDIGTFICKLRNLLSDFDSETGQEEYVDLAAIQNLTTAGELADTTVPRDKLVVFQEMMMSEIARCNSDKVKIGINELLKHLLRTINKDTEHYLSERYLYRLRMIFKRCLMPDFPFPEEIWNYICDCLRSVGAYLVENEYYIAAREIIDSLAQMGRIAALKGMPTANTQSSLRLIENKALVKNQKELASVAKNARFNLET